ncbi:hypothetical protein FEE88_21970 [Salmonella enterica subsp. enterica serovar Montevideo]|nr:hypothetical protein [Salmonella enterica subsp. enterica serovar Montevideo]
MGSCAAPSAKGDDKFITTDYLQQCPLEKRSGSEENALAMLAMTAFTLMTRRGICEMQNVAPDGKGIRLELIGFRGNETIPDTLH